MGQTLPNGIYLPAEGERNCYDGLEGNWRSLDSLISTVAGKASATHTHGNITNDGKVGTTANLPLITGTGGAVQAGSFGNQANTFCEGNDSRLSDARTPVVHTHTKSDVTDLLNSNFIPLANNSYDLGSSSYQWNKIYSADVVHTSGNETITGVKTLVDYWHLQAKNLKAGEGETYGRTGYSFIYTDKNDVTMGDVTLFKNANAARTFIRIRSGDYYTNGAPAAAGTLVQSALMVGTNVSGKKIIECDSDIVYPTTNNTTDLGTSTNKWKTLNGVNPGALSLPKTDSSITGIETSGFSFDGTNERIPDTVNIFSNGEALMNGWLCARLAEGAGHYIFLSSDDNIGRYGICSSCFSSGIVTTLSFGINVYVPIKVGDKPAIRWAKPNGGNAQLVFYPCLGNV